MLSWDRISPALKHKTKFYQKEKTLSKNLNLDDKKSLHSGKKSKNLNLSNKKWETSDKKYDKLKKKSDKFVKKKS